MQQEGTEGVLLAAADVDRDARGGHVVVGGGGGGAGGRLAFHANCVGAEVAARRCRSVPLQPRNPRRCGILRGERRPREKGRDAAAAGDGDARGEERFG